MYLILFPLHLRGNVSVEGERLQEEQETVSSTHSQNTQESGTTGSISSTSETRLSKSNSSGSHSAEVLIDTEEATSQISNSSTRDSSGLRGQRKTRIIYL